MVWLQDELRSAGAVTLAGAAEQFGVSEMTVRRDLRLLEAQGVARRVRGGAVASGPVSFKGREQSYSQEKLAIARKLLLLVPRRGVIAIDSSSTMNKLAALIPGASDLTIVTNGWENFTALRSKPGIHAVLTGGSFDERSESLVGPVALATATSFTFSHVFMSAAAFSAEHGAFEDTLEEASVKAALARSSESIVLGINTAKIGRRSAAVSVRTDAISILCTEASPDVPAVRELASIVRSVS